MKRSLLLLLSVIIATTMMAEGITTEQAAEIARQFINKQQQAAESPTTGSGQAAQGRQMRMVAKRQMPMSVATEDNCNAYYVFNIGSDNGYVMVSGSDLTPQVLGYAIQGSFDEENMPANMKAWLDGYADQIAYIERTEGQNQAPALHINRDAIGPLLTTTWDQIAPYNLMCPIINGHQAPTGCAATALAQVLNYHKYPAKTLKPIPAYTTITNEINMPEVPVTDIDWNNIADHYDGSETTEQKKAVATLMKLCGQATLMDYQETGSRSYIVYYINALREYFGYDEGAQRLLRKFFLASEWEAIIYNELANDRPVIYDGQSTGGGHAFVVDGYDGNGLFHINWGWGGSSDGYFLLSVLNPDNNESVGSSPSKDGFSMEQDVIVGIQHGTGEKVPDWLTISAMTNLGESDFTRGSDTEDFSGISIAAFTINYNDEKGVFWVIPVILDGNGNIVQTCANARYSSYEIYNVYENDFKNISFGAGLADGDYYISLLNRCADSEEWTLCWCSDVNRIKATIRDNKLTLTPPTVKLSATFSSNNSAKLYRRFNVQAQITNEGTDFNDYVYLSVGNTIVGGRMFEAKAGETVTFDIDFVPETSGKKALILGYYDIYSNFVPFATGFVTIEEEGEPQLTATTTLTNANSEGNVEETTVNASALFRNIGDGTGKGEWVFLEIKKYNLETAKWDFIERKYKFVTIFPGDSTTFEVSFEDLEMDGRYLMKTCRYLENGSERIGKDIAFDVIDPAAPAPAMTGTISLKNANANGDIEGTTVNAEFTIQNTGTGALENGGIWIELYQVDESGQSEILKYIGQNSITLGVRESISGTASFDNIKVGGKYFLVLTYSRYKSLNYIKIANSTLHFNGVEDTSGIEEMADGRRLVSDAWYTLDGRKLKSQASSTKGLVPGVYIINKRKVLVR